MAPKLIDVHLNPQRFQKKKVLPLTFSEMTTLVSCNVLTHNAFDTIDFINKLFDVFNSRPISTEVTNPKGRKCFSIPFSNWAYQKDFLNLISKYFQHLEIQKFSAGKN